MIIGKEDPASFYLGAVSKTQAICFLEKHLSYLDRNFQLIFEIPQLT